jgi:hypothetical protein
MPTDQLTVLVDHRHIVVVLREVVTHKDQSVSPSAVVLPRCIFQRPDEHGWHVDIRKSKEPASLPDAGWR